VGPKILPINSPIRNKARAITQALRSGTDHLTVPNKNSSLETDLGSTVASLQIRAKGTGLKSCPCHRPSSIKHLLMRVTIRALEIHLSGEGERPIAVMKVFFHQ